MASGAGSQSHKERRYDRQLRLWGEHGQAAMEECSVCLINGSAVGAEALKNLVLPGIGSFTIVDGATVCDADLGNNFFVEQAAVGTSRAACVTKLLQELNEHVAGSYVSDDIGVVLDSRPDYLAPFSLVIATQLPGKDAAHVAAACAAASVPLLIAHAYGLLGYLRLVLPEHAVTEAHPDHALPDLRLLKPPAALRELVAARFADLDSLDSAEYAHVPFVVLLLRAVDTWSAANGGALPTTYAQKKELRAIVASYRRPAMQADQNIDEALAALNTALSVPEPPSAVRAVLRAARERVSRLAREMLSPAVSPAENEATLRARRGQLRFWLMAAAVNAFVDAEGCGLLPAVGAIPDMTADTDSYIALQAVYQQLAAHDLACVAAHAQQIASTESLPAEMLAPGALKIFCQNSHHLAVLSYRTLDDEHSSPNTSALGSALTDGSGAGELYVLLRAAHAFRAERSSWPGEGDDVDADVPVLKQFVVEALKEAGLNGGASPPIDDDYIGEFCRWGGSELHAVASLIGGVASQEAIKAITHQYVPLNNTFIFNGAAGTTATLEL